MAKILIHICCAPCAIYPLKKLREKGDDVTGFWYNPNIYPEGEYQRRLKCLEAYAEREKVKIIYDEHKKQKSLFRDSKEERCLMCYQLRLERTASVSSEYGFDLFTTTLLISPYQKHELIRETGQKAGRKAGASFLYTDFRNGYREGSLQAREMNLYRQRYCGCAHSKEGSGFRG
jgi:predicted adenine nucleotide alpha hydrolase (AANH) superfamily ATPase